MTGVDGARWCPRHPSVELTRSDDHVCDGCVAGLRSDLLSLIERRGLLADLEATRTRWVVRPRQVGGGSGKRAQPVPFDERVAPVLADLRGALLDAALVAWAPRDVALHELGRADVHDLAVYLLDRLSWLQGRESAPVLLGAVRDAVAAARRMVDVPHARQWLGECGSTDDRGGDRCGEPLWAGHGDTAIVCRACGVRWNVAQRQTWALAVIDDQLMTLWAMARVSAASDQLLGESVTIGRLDKWRAQRRILPVHGPWPEGVAGPQLFRVGDVRRVVLSGPAARARIVARLAGGLLASSALRRGESR